MSDFLNDEEVPPMPPLSMALIERVGEQVLEELEPAALHSPRGIDFAQWAEYGLQRYKICVSPARVEELGDRIGATDPVDHGDGITEILIEAVHYEELLAGGRQAHMARGTFLHEAGHAILHVPVMRRRIASNNSLLLNRRVRRDAIQAFRDPEWQAWALAGCIVAPRRTIVMAGTLDPRALATIYGMSVSFMRAHLRRLKLQGGEPMM